MSEKLKELISLLYQDRLTNCGKDQLVEIIEKLQAKNTKLRFQDIPYLEGEIEAYKVRIEELKNHKNRELVLVNNKQYFIDENLYEDLFEDIKNNYVPKSKIKDKIKLNYKKVTNLEIQYKKALPRNREKIREDLTKLDGMCMAYIELIKEF